MNHGRRAAAVFWVLGAILLAARFAWVFAVPQDVSGTVAAIPNETNVEIMGWVSSLPDRRPTSTRYKISVTNVRRGNETRPITGKIMAIDRRTWPPYSYGDSVVVTGTLAVPEAFNGFDYAAYLKAQSIDRIIDRALFTASAIDARPSLARWSPLRALGVAKEWFERRITLVVPDPHASLLMGLLTGSKGGLPDDIVEHFRIAGLSHVVAVSGYNITIVLSLLSGALFFVPKKKRFVLLVVGVSCFVLLVGAEAPVLRAGIMGILGLIAIQAERIATPRQLIALTGMLLCLWNPRSLTADPGFQLSFLATIGIAELGPLLKKWLRFLPETLAIRESLAVTIAAQIATLPVSVILFQNISLIAPLSNLFVAPLIPITMLIGSIAAMLSILHGFLGLLIGSGAWVLLSSMLSIAELAASVPFASITF